MNNAAGFLFLLLIVSALGLVTSRNESRKLFRSYEELRHIEQEINSQQTKLLLERGYLAKQSRIESLSIKNLNMQYPQSLDTVIVPPPPAPIQR
jgi:cell division protein FtsL